MLIFGSCEKCKFRGSDGCTNKDSPENGQPVKDEGYCDKFDWREFKVLPDKDDRLPIIPNPYPVDPYPYPRPYPWRPNPWKPNIIWM